MKRLFISVVALLAGLIVQNSQAETTVFVNVNVVPMNDEAILPNRSVVVRDGKIAAIGSVDSVPVPKQALIVDGTDRYLMPGLAEMHAHVTTLPTFERLATLFVANGVTTIRGMLGHETHLALRDALKAGERFGPRLITSGPSLNGRSVSGAQDAARKVEAQLAAGFDFIKVHPGLDSAEFDALARTANEVGIPYAGHVPVAAGVRHALAMDIATIDHLDGYFVAMMPPASAAHGGYGGFFDILLADALDERQIDTIAAETAAAGTWNVPTEVLIEQLVDGTPVTELKARPEMRFVPPETLSNWVAAKQRQLGERGFDEQLAARGIALRRRLILALHEAGAGLLLGSDAPQVFNVPGYSLHRELEVLVAAGLTPYEALYTGTVAVAEFLGTNTGTVTVGRDADLVLVDADPLADIANAHRIHGVMVRGDWYGRRDLDERLERYVVGKRE